MNTKFNKFLNFLNKKIILNISLFEFLLFSILTLSGLLIFIFGIINKVNETWQNWVSSISIFIDAPLGIIAALSLSRKWKISPLLLMIDAILYGLANFFAGQLALGVIDLIFTPLLWIFAYGYLWRDKIKNNNEVETRKLNIIGGIITILLIIFISSILGILLMNNTNPLNGNYPNWLRAFNSWFDSFASILMLVAVIFGILRLRETFFMYFIANIFKIILFSLLIIYGSQDHYALLIMAIIYFINAIYGMIIWKNSKLIKKNDN